MVCQFCSAAVHADSSDHKPGCPDLDPELDYGTKLKLWTAGFLDSANGIGPRESDATYWLGYMNHQSTGDILPHFADFILSAAASQFRNA